MGGTRCRTCGQELPAEARFCDACGATVAAKPVHRTLLGMTAPAVATTRVVDVADATAPQPAPVPEASRDIAAVAPVPVRRGTMMGVAIPGVAPIARPPEVPRFEPPPPPASPPPAATSAPQTPIVADAVDDDRMTIAPPLRQTRSRVPVVIAIVFALIAIAGLAWVGLQLFGAKAKPSLDARVEMGVKGVTVIVRCAACDDGGEIAIGDRRATFADREAKLSFDDDDVAVGVTTMRGALTSAPGKKPIDVAFDVTRLYSVHVSLAALAEGKGVEVVFALASAVSALRVDGADVPIEDGAAEKTIAIAPAIDESATTAARKVTFALAVEGGGDVDGEIGFSVPYAPLVVSLPGAHPYALGGAIGVAGKTKARATVRANGVAIVAGADGVFEGTAKIGADGKLDLVAFGDGVAPREKVIATTEVASAEDLVKSLRAQAKTPFAAIAASPDAHRGEVVDVKVIVRRADATNGRAVVAGDAKCGGDACPVLRVLLPAGAHPASGDVLEAIGFVTRGVPFEGKTAAELDAAVVLPSK